MREVEDLDNLYFDWLYSQVMPPLLNPAHSKWNLARTLYSTKFEFFIRNDENRAEDGSALRYEFTDSEDYKYDEVEQSWVEMDCSIFEMLVALCRRLSVEDDRGADEWMDELLRNLNLAHFSDKEWRHNCDSYVRLELHIFNQRMYQPDGTGGGLFPLSNTDQDQRSIEIWYQMAAYLLEREL